MTPRLLEIKARVEAALRAEVASDSLIYRSPDQAALLTAYCECNYLLAYIELQAREIDQLQKAIAYSTGGTRQYFYAIKEADAVAREREALT